MHLEHRNGLKFKSVLDTFPKICTIEDTDIDRISINKQSIMKFVDTTNIVTNKNTILRLFWNSFDKKEYSNKALLKTLCWRITPQRLVWMWKFSQICLHLKCINVNIGQQGD